MSDGPPTVRTPLFSDRPWEFHDPDASNPKATKETITALARKHTVEAIQTLVFHMRNPRNPELSMAAADMLLSRGWGKPPQVTGLIDASTLTGTGAVPLTLEEKIAILTNTAEPAPTPVPSDAPQPIIELQPDPHGLLD